MGEMWLQTQIPGYVFAWDRAQESKHTDTARPMGLSSSREHQPFKKWWSDIWDSLWNM